MSSRGTHGSARRGALNPHRKHDARSQGATAQSSVKTPGPLRTLTLTLNLLNTRIGLTAQELLEVVPGYLSSEGGDSLANVDRDSAMRKLERDIAALRTTGLDVVVERNWTDPADKPRYRIQSDERDQAQTRFTPAELSVLVKALGAWSGEDATQTQVILNKLLGKSDAGAAAGKPTTLLGLEGAQYVTLLDRARGDEQPVAFDYQSRAGRSRREVAPWSLVVRGQALYLWGFDLNKWEPRLFRLSRFRSEPELIAEPGAVASVGTLKDADLDHLSVAPRLAVARGGAPLTRLRCLEPDVEAPADLVPVSWDVLQGRTDDVATWEATVLREADQVVILEPRWLADSVYQRLRLAARWGDHSG